MNPTTLLIIVATLALLIIVGTVFAVIRVLRQPQNSTPKSVAPIPAGDLDQDEPETNTPAVTETLPPDDPADFDTFLDEQRPLLGEFELEDLSNSYKGFTQAGQRAGTILHHTDNDKGLIAFTAQAFSPQNGVVTAETAYGKMELILTQGKAGVKWDGSPLGVLDYANQRILGPEGQLLGSMERPPMGQEAASYPVSFVGQKAADVTTKINMVSTLRWFDNEEESQPPAFQDVSTELEDTQTLILLGTLLLEFGFMDLLRTQ